MKNILREARFGLKRRSKITVMLFIQLIISFTLITVLLTTALSLIHNQSLFGSLFKTDEVYQLSDMALDDVIDPYIHEVSGLHKLKSFYLDLSKNTNYLYLEKHLQPTEIADFSGSDIFLGGYEEGNVNSPREVNQKQYSDVKTCQLNSNAIQYYQLSVCKGELLSQEDMTCTSLTIPVLLGYEYSGVYDIGDTLDAEYLLTNYQFLVVGILKPNSVIVEGESMLYLDRYIIMPSLSWDTESIDVGGVFTQGATYLNKINGTVVLRDGYTLTDFVNYLENCRLSDGIGFDLTILSQTFLTLSIIKSTAYESSQNMFAIIALLFVFCGMSTFFAIYYKVKSNAKTYSILLICGYQTKEIEQIVFAEFMLLFSIALLTSLFLSLYMLSSTFQIAVFVMTALLSYLLLFLASRFVKIKDLTTESKGE